jgi:uncharacterized coiled-coil protein SlyX
MTKSVLETLGSDLEEFVLLDVGSSGGIADHWRIYGDRLRAFGFDPWIEDCDRLNAEEISTKINYVASLVGITDASHWYLNGGAFKIDDALWQRSSTLAVPALHPDLPNFTPYQWQDSATRAASGKTFATNKIQIDPFVNDHKLGHVDFLKIDTDGDDFEVLLGSERTLAERGVLGIYIESEFHGPTDERSNTFANIDRYLRASGFTLYGLAPYKYSRAALPAVFQYGIPAQTISGQAYWADAFYFRDLAADGHPFANMDKHQWRQKLLKLATLFELHNLADCAAELISVHQDELAPYIDVTMLLDRLTPSLGGRNLSYQDYLAEFRTSLTHFYPPIAVAGTSTEEVYRLNDRIKALEIQVAASAQTINLLEQVVASQKESIERGQNLYAAALRAQLEGVKF